MRTLPVARLLAPLLAGSFALLAQYKAEPAGGPPPELASGIAQALQTPGTKITNNGTAYCEIWLRTAVPAGAKSAEESVTLPMIPQGALLGAIRFDGNGADRRGQTIKPGVYTLRYSIIPINGDHQGAAPQRDFLLMTPAADDKDLNATPNFDALVAMSRKASLTPHPAVLSVWKADNGTLSLTKQGDSDWVLQTKIGDTPIAIILVGVASS
jgi:hypothetical protein